MKLEYLGDISDNGKFKQVVTDELVRLYDFDTIQVNLLRSEIQRSIIKEGRALILTNLEYVKPINCSLTLRISDSDVGITTTDKKSFFCDLTLNAYQIMSDLLEPFSEAETNGYQWLYDFDNPIAFLFSPGGQW
jgi:hypothetical protein